MLVGFDVVTDNPYENEHGPAPKPVVGGMVDVKVLVKVFAWLKKKLSKKGGKDGRAT